MLIVVIRGNIYIDLSPIEFHIRKDFLRSSRPELFLKISQILQENICARVSFLIKLSILNIILWKTVFQLSIFHLS